MADGDQFMPTRRGVLKAGAASLSAGGVVLDARPAAASSRAASRAVPLQAECGTTIPVTLEVNGASHALMLDPRVTLLDALREHLLLTGTKKGCDHGQCGACTVILNGHRINSCLSLAVMHDGEAITTIEGLGHPQELHPMQSAFVKHDGYQCGYCTPGQICSAVAMLAEYRAGMPSHVTGDLLAMHHDLTDAELRERMSGNICRCSAYPNIVAAIRDASGEIG